MNIRRAPVLSAAFAFSILMLFAVVTQAAVVRDTDVRQTQQMKVVYPEPGAEIDRKNPMITVDLTAVNGQADPKTVSIILNGVNVTGAADITASYIMYRPIEDLAPGYYEVRVEAKNTSGKDVDALTWLFRILGPGETAQTGDATATGASGEHRVGAPEQFRQYADNTQGRLITSTDYVQADFTQSSTYDVNKILPEKEGMKLNIDFEFANSSEGRTIVSSMRRETQLYTDVEIDKGRINYYDDEIEASLGHFWIDLSNLTVAGSELGGLRLDHTVDKWDLTLFSGRTQDPSTSGTFKQIASGFRSAYHWDTWDTHKTTFTILTAQENDDAVYSQLDDPARDTIVSVMHQVNFNEHWNMMVEGASNDRRVSGNTMMDFKDQAVRFLLNAKYKQAEAQVILFDIDQNFVPIGDGNRQNMNSNREGFKVSGKVMPAKWITAGGDYEENDSIKNTTTMLPTRTKKGTAFVALSSGPAVNVNYRYSKLVNDEGTLSETDSVSVVLYGRKIGALNNTRFIAGWQQVDYTDTQPATDIMVNNELISFSFKTRVGNALGIFASYAEGDVEALVANAVTESRRSTYALDWFIKPSRLTLSEKYELFDMSGTTVNTEEEKFSSLLRYVRDDVYTYTLGWDLVTYENVINPVFNYDETVLRTGVEWNF